MSPTQHHNEIRLTQVCLAVTAAATALLCWSTGTVAWAAWQEDQHGRLLEALFFGTLAGYLVYGNMGYQLARIGQLQRVGAHRAAGPESHPTYADGAAPGITVLVPSYKEEISVIRQTLLSAALQDYPNKRVVLLLDDPPRPVTPEDHAALATGRSLPFELQALLKEASDHLADARAAFLARRASSPVTLADECVRLSDSFRWAAQWLETQAKRTPAESHTDIWFIEQTLTQPADLCRGQAATWFARRREAPSGPIDALLDDIDAAYAGLAGRFCVELDVFERKLYVNLSHEPNKAMNLNSYLGLMGRRLKLVSHREGRALEETSVLTGSRLIPDSPYVITLDADSLIKPEYAATLVRLMERPEHARTAVAQTPYSAIPNAPGALERTAGATTDIQYLVHQGFTYYGATFWVGANALLRKSALEEICQEEFQGGGMIRRYIQDRTVIEDTESTVDLLAHNWSLFNYPERLAYSATPPDFGSLVIQRARWANGGLLILPKFLSFLRHAPAGRATAAQSLLQFHYLTSLAAAPLSVLLLSIMPFASELMTPWTLLAALPYFVLYARDLSASGYRPMRDLLRVYALNLLLIPVHLGGALMSLRQALAGTKIPFRRTPKISGRTRTAGLDLALQLAMVLTSTGLAVYYGSQMRWMSAAFPLANAALLLYGISRFIGFAELTEDLAVSLHQSLTRRKGPGCWNAPLLAGLASARPVRLWTSSSSNTRMFSRQVLWMLIAALEMLSPAMASGTVTAGLTAIQIENRKPGTTEWILAHPARHHEIEGYASRTSVNRGETLQLFVNTQAARYTIRIFRLGWYDGLGARELGRPISRPGRVQPEFFMDARTGLIECRWTDPIPLKIPLNPTDATDWASGLYVAKLTAEPSGHESYITFVVRDDARASVYLVQSSVTTFQAYNNWGGKSLYAFNSTGGQATKVSFDRPYAGSPIEAAASGTGAGDLFTSNSIPAGYPASAAGWEYNFIRWLEREGYDATYATNLDVHRDPTLLASHAAFLSVGHDEYWSAEMRRHVEQARDQGVHLGFFSSNTCYWQIRLEPGPGTGEPDRTIVAYKETAPWHDPLFLDQRPQNDHLVTTKWRNPPVNRPEASLLGSMFVEVDSPVDGDFVLEEPEEWITKGTGLTKGATLRGLLGYEVDGVSASSPAGTHVVARSSVPGLDGAATWYRAPSGALVFASGSMQWSWALDDYQAPRLRRSVLSQAVQQMTRNILARLGGAHDE